MRVGVTLLCCLILGTGRAMAQDAFRDSSHAHVTRPLGDALLSYASAVRIDLIFDPLLVRGMHTSRRVRLDAPPETELRRLLDGTDLGVHRLPSGTFVLAPLRPRAETRPAHRLSAVQGFVVDPSDRPLDGVHVFVDTLGVGAATDDGGRFVLRRLPPGRHALRITHVGYHPATVTVSIRPEQVADLRIALTPEVFAFAPLLKEDRRGQFRLRAAASLTVENGLHRPRGLGTADAVRGLDDVPGVRVGKVLADVHLQGSEPGEHQFQLDGVPVFEPVHLRGLVGAFNPFAIERVTVHKAGYGVTYGSFLAGVIAAEHALPQAGIARIDAQTDPLSLNVLASGRLVDRPGVQAQGMIAVRTSLWSVYPNAVAGPQRRLLRDWNTPDPFLLNASVLGLLSEFDDLFGGELLARVDSSQQYGLDPTLGFRDLHAAGRLHLGSRHQFDASLYNGTNHLSGNQIAVRTAGDPVDAGDRASARVDGIAVPRDRYAWTNTTAQIRYRTLLSSRALAEVRLRGSQYDLGHDYSGLEPGDSLGLPLPDGTPFSFRVVERVQPSDDGNRIGEGALESRLDVRAAARLHLTFGSEIVHTRHRFLIEDANLSFAEQSFRTIHNAARTWRLGAFSEQRLDLSGRVTATTGLRVTYLPTRARAYAEPRAELRYEALGRRSSLSARLAGGLYRQYVNQFHVSSISPSALFPAVRFWLPVDSTVVPPKAYHLASSLLWSPVGPLSLRAEAYLKRQVHQLAIDYAALWRRARVDTTGRPQASFLRAGSGFTHGVALGAAFDTAPVRLSVRGEYSLARRTRTLGAEPTADPARAAAPDADARYEPVPWSEPFRLEASAEAHPAAGLSLTLRWHSAWGRTWAFRQAYYDYIASDPQTTQKIFGPYDFLRPQDHRLRPLHQLDVGIAYERPLGPARLLLRADVLNVLDRPNEADWTMVVDKDDTGTLTYEHVSRLLLPRLPSFAVRLQW